MKLKDKIIKNRVGILIFIGVLLVVTIIIGISYAYFFNIEIKNNNTISGNINTKYYTFATSGNKTISIALEQDKLNIAEGSNDYTSFMSNTGANITIFLAAIDGKKVYCTYDLVYVPSTAYVPSTEAKNAGLKELTLSGTTAAGYKFDDVDISGSNTVTLMKNALISTNGQYGHNWKFTVKYYNLNVIQDNVIGKTFGGNIKVANVDCSFNDPARIGDEVILLDNGNGATTVEDAKAYIESKGTPDFSKVATTSEGLYAAQDDLGTSYYFRGAVDNNWVKFGREGTKDIYWRIIRINGDGSIRMIYSGTTAPTESTKVVMTGVGTQIGTSAFNSSDNKAEHVGYMYTEGQQHGNSTSSTIKSTIDNWYTTTTLEKDAEIKALVSQDQIYCNDRTASTLDVAYSNTNYTTLTSWNSTGTQYYYGARGRLTQTKISPQLICPTASDKFTSNKGSIGNKALEYPVGLITADEAEMAGGVYDVINSSYYLFSNQLYWLGSPDRFYSSDYDYAYEFYVHDAGIIDVDGVSTGMGVRPVVSLSSKAKLFGSGTYNHVYTVS